MNYLFAYSTSLSSFLQSKGFRYICVGINKRSGGEFHLYEKTPQLSEALDEYDAVKHAL